MSFSLKKLGNIITNPISNIGDVLRFGGSKGPKNPYQPADFSFLRDPVAGQSDYKFLLNSTTPDYSFLRDPIKAPAPIQGPDYSFLRTPARGPDYSFLTNQPATPDVSFLRQPASGAAAGYRPFDNYYSAPTATAPGLFESYLSRINAPSSVDAVKGQLNQQGLDLLLNQINRDTDQNFGNKVTEFFNRGLVGPGVSSDIAATGLGQVAGQGAEAAAGARLQYSLQDLQRLAAREEAARQAYSQQYQGGLASDAQARGIAAQGAVSDASNYANLLTGDQGNKAKYDLAYADILNQGAGRQVDINKVYAGILEQGAGRENANLQQYANLLDTQAGRENANQQQTTNLQNQNLLAYADSMKTNAILGQSDKQLYASLLDAATNRQNQRDIASVGGQAGAYGNAVNSNTAGQKPGLLEDFLKSYLQNLGKTAGGQ